MTSSNGNIFRVTDHLCGNSTVTGEFPGQWRGALMFSLICDWINGWMNNREAGDLRRHGAHYDVTVTVLESHGIWQLSRDLKHGMPCIGEHISEINNTSHWRHISLRIYYHRNFIWPGQGSRNSISKKWLHICWVLEYAYILTQCVFRMPCLSPILQK